MSRSTRFNANQLGIRDTDIRYPKRIRALLDPLVDLPPVMAVPPTIGTPINVDTRGTTDPFGSLLLNPICVPYYNTGLATNGENVNCFRNYGWSRTVAGPGGANQMGRATPPHGLLGGSYPSSVEFYYDGAGFEMRFRTFTGSGVQFQLYVDDQPMNAIVVSNPLTINLIGVAFLIPVTFASSRTRKIRIDFDRNQAFGGINIAGSDLCVAAMDTAANKLQLYICGDSYTDGAAGVVAIDTYAIQLGKLLNMDTWVEGQGGTGFTADSTPGAKSRYIGRIPSAASELRLDPDVVVLQTSTNDGNDFTSGTNAGPAATVCIAQVRKQWPRAKILVPGLMMMVAAGSMPSTNVRNNSTVRAAATDPLTGADLFVDPLAEGWYTGSANINTPGTGNSGRYRFSDNVHGTPAWHAMTAKLLARKFAGFLTGID